MSQFALLLNRRMDKAHGDWSQAIVQYATRIQVEKLRIKKVELDLYLERVVNAFAS